MAEPSTLRDLFLEHGEVCPIRNDHPLVIDTPGDLLLVISGNVELFCADRVGPDEFGTRENLLSVPTGELLCTMDPCLPGVSLLASGVLGTMVVRLSIVRLRQLQERGLIPATELEKKVHGWIRRLGERVATATGDVQVDQLIQKEGPLKVKAHQRTGCVNDTFWVEASADDVRFVGINPLDNLPQGTLIPLTASCWVEAPADVTLNVYATQTILAHDSLWFGLDQYQRQFADIAILALRSGSLDELSRQGSKAQYRKVAIRESLSDLVAVMDETLPDIEEESTETGESDELLMAACSAICDTLGLVAKRHPDMRPGLDSSVNLSLIAKASRFKTRSVRLEGDWWTKDHGPLLSFRMPDRSPVAILPWKPGGYYIQDVRDGTVKELTRSTAAGLVPYAECLYRSFPDGTIGAKEFVKFAAHGLAPEFRSIVILSVLAGILSMAVPLATSKIFDSVIPSADREMLLHYAVALTTAALATAAFEVARGIAVLRVEGRMDQSGQAAIWSRLLDLPMTFFRRHTAGDLAERAYAVDHIRTIISQVGVTSVLGISTVLFQGFTMVFISVKLAALGAALVLLMTLVIMTANWMQLRHQRKEYAIRGRITGLVLQLFTGVGKIRVAAAEDHAFRLWAREFSSQKRIGFIIGRIQNFVQIFNGGFPIICSMTIFAVYMMIQKSEAAAGAAGASTISTGQFIAFNTALTAVVGAVVQLGLGTLTLLEIIPVFERVRPVLSEEPEVGDDRRHPGDLRGNIELYHVNFRYHENGPLILKGLDLTIRKGEFVALVGPSGSGKSTVLRLLLGFDRPESGYVYYDKQDLNTLDLREVRRQIGAVLQSSQLMPTTIFHNIIGSRTHFTIDDAWRAARMSGLDDDIREMAMGMQTVVNEGGGGFSGGQKQRLMIARALVNRPRIVYFDEATSALDNRTQNIVTKSLRELDATRVTIAHRLSTVVDADRIIVMKDGRIEEMGTYNELMKLNGLFAELASRQHVEGA